MRTGVRMTFGFANCLFETLPLHSPVEHPCFTGYKAFLIGQRAGATSRLIDEFNDLAADFRISFARKTKGLSVL